MYKYWENGNKIILVGYQPFSASKKSGELTEKIIIRAINELGRYKINIKNIKDFLKHKQ